MKILNLLLMLFTTIFLQAKDNINLSKLIAKRFIKANAHTIINSKGQNLGAILPQYVVNLFDVSITNKFEGSSNNYTVILKIAVNGSKENFQNKGFLESEEKTLKRQIIKKYISEVNKLKSSLSSSIILDSNTKVTHLPVYNSLNNYHMELVTVFSKKEFESLLNKYLKKHYNTIPNSEIQAQENSSNFKNGFFAGSVISLTAMFLILIAYKS